ncbi:hypothetical protein D9611_009731 [Ephemerocybe angulata]|uniref:Uncharacterized protein n=1 Tax=Ephemerocybe angulata TaxID=980116 RepID=A0A8H5C5W6_9AGAR|nr:hypothetical protein D9611_009731 [Tulosesus angulatus]
MTSVFRHLVVGYWPRCDVLGVLRSSLVLPEPTDGSMELVAHGSPVPETGSIQEDLPLRYTLSKLLKWKNVSRDRAAASFVELGRMAQKLA